ncbi:hypothetical protein QYM36_014916 [Artemia franciscana]|nr:hypothetical protein QYM36_014916 [Artemia franciscana]
MTKLEAVILLRYKGSDKVDEIEIQMPDSVTSNGTCSQQVDDETQQNLIWGNFSLCLIYARNETSWNLRRILFTISNADQLFGKSVRGGQNDVVLTSVSTTAIEAPVGYAYHCDSDTKVELLSDLPYEATLVLDDLHIQPFLENNAEFGPDISCPEDYISHRRKRDETVPIAVGSALAVATLATVIGYSIYRHFKVRDVIYGTME